ncbi:MAG: site-2 protease family protein [Caldiserica bacterium]|jgi:Zn-dependent protease|nr:site-2 protease family protein [Caldisericota bacterium]
MFTKDYFINLGLFVLPAVIIILTLHEFGHAYAAYKMGDETAKREGRLSLNPLRHIDPFGMIALILFRFGWGKPVPVDFFALRNLRKGMVVVSLAGPAINFLTALALSPLYKLMYNSSVMQAGFSYFIVLVEYIIIYSVYLGIFNLIPIPPLDGSKVLFAISKRPQRFLFDESMNWYGMIFLIILISIPFFNFGNLFLSIINPILKFLL